MCLLHAGGVGCASGFGALLGLFTLLLALAATGLIYQAVATAIDRRAFAPAGRMVELTVTGCTSPAPARAARR